MAGTQVKNGGFRAILQDCRRKGIVSGKKMNMGATPQDFLHSLQPPRMVEMVTRDAPPTIPHDTQTVLGKIFQIIYDKQL